MRKINELSYKDLKDVCNPNLFKFETTKELVDPTDLIYGLTNNQSLTLFSSSYLSLST